MEFVLDGPVMDPAAAWARVADADTLAREGGLPPLTWGFTPGADGFGTLTGTLLGPAGIRHGFEERDHGWARGQSLWVDRVIDGPLLKAARYRGEVVETADGAVPRLSFSAEPASRLSTPTVAVLVRGLRRQWRRMLDRPADARRRRLDAESRDAVERWRRRGAPPEIVAPFVRWVERASDAALRDVRPLALARAWGRDPGEALGWLLEGTATGLVELHFVVQCPGCRGATARVPRLSLLEDRGMCPACGSTFAVDLRDHVEARLLALPRLAPTEAERWASLLPRDRPSVAALALLPPGGEVTLRASLAPGCWRVSPGSGAPPTLLEVTEGGPDAASVTLGEGGTVACGPGPVRLHLRNGLTRRARAVVVSDALDPTRLSAARLATFPTYRGVFGTQTLAPGVHLDVSRIALLVSDLVASHALYARVGDRAALAWVTAHLAEVEAVVTDYGGVRVKTVGDSLFAAFDDPADAARAALVLPGRMAAWSRAQGVPEAPPTRVGVAAGPALAAHSDASGLDWFGATANLAVTAARLAGAGEVWWTAEVGAALGALPEGWSAEPAPRAPYVRVSAAPASPPSPPLRQR